MMGDVKSVDKTRAKSKLSERERKSTTTTTSHREGRAIMMVVMMKALGSLFVQTDKTRQDNKKESKEFVEKERQSSLGSSSS